MKDKHYIQDYSEGIFKSLFEEYACVNCGLIPKYDIKQLVNGVDTKIKTWDKEVDDYICIECIRVKKMKKITKIINRK